MKVFNILILGLMVVLMMAGTASATTYYVRTDGNDGNAGTSNTSGGAWLTINKCTTTIVAGDICRVQSGTYVETATFSNSGTAGNPITIIGDGMPVMDGSALGSAFEINEQSYITIDGIKMIDYSTGVNIEPSVSNSYNITIINSNFTDITNSGINAWGQDEAWSYYLNVSNNIFQNTPSTLDTLCAFNGAITINELHDSKISNNTMTGGYGFSCGNGYHDVEVSNNTVSDMPGRFISVSYGVTDSTNVTVRGNILTNIGDRVIRFDYNTLGTVIQDNVISGSGWVTDFYPGGQYQFINNTQYGGWFASYNSHDTLIANNRFVCNGDTVGFYFTGSEIVQPARQNVNYTVKNNDFYDCAVWVDDFVSGSSVRNNIFHTSTVDISGSTGLVVEYNDVYASTITGATSVNSITADPLFNNIAGNDFHLKSQFGRWDGSTWVITDTQNSPAIDTFQVPLSISERLYAPNGFETLILLKYCTVAFDIAFPRLSKTYPVI